MNIVRCVPVVLSILLLGAHFLRDGNLVVVAILALLPFLLFLRRSWVPKVFVAVLLVGGAEWVRTLVALAAVRQEHGQPWVRMAIILGAVALVTVASSFVFAAKSLRERYRLNA